MKFRPPRCASAGSVNKNSSVTTKKGSPPVLKTFKYRLYPTKRQQQLLNEHLDELRWLWNTLLAERKQAWEE